jgi:hypothetical protein
MPRTGVIRLKVESDEQKRVIKEIVGKVENDRKIIEQIEKTKSYPWVRIIEGMEKRSEWP